MLTLYQDVNIPIMVKDLESDELLDVNIKNTTGYGVWANDNEHIFYTRKTQKH